MLARRDRDGTSSWCVWCVHVSELRLPSTLSRCGVPQLGTYNPLQTRDGSKEIRLRTDRIKYWISEGAQPSDSMARLLGLAGILPMPPIRWQPTKSTPRKEREFHTLPDWSGALDTAAAAGVSPTAPAALNVFAGLDSRWSEAPSVASLRTARSAPAVGALAPTGRLL